VPDIKTIKMKIQIQLVILVLILSSCAISAINRPGRQIITKGFLKNLTDTVKVVTVFSYSHSFADYRRSKSRVADNQWKIFDSIKFVKELHTFLDKRNFNFQLVINPVNYSFVDSILDIIHPSSDFDLSHQLSNNIQDSNTVLIIYARFNINSAIDHSILGPIGETTFQDQITSHSMLIKNRTLVYHQSNFINTLFKGNRFYRRSIYKVLNDAFKD